MDRVSAVQDGVHSPTSTDTTASGSILSLTPIAVFPRSSHSSASSFDPQRSHITLIENDSSIVTVPVVLPPTGEPGHQSSGSDDDDRKGRSGSNSESGEGGGESVDAREETARGLEERLESRTFALDPRGYVRSAKFSEGSKFLAVLRSAKSIEFFRVEADRLTAVSEVVRNTKSSDAILGFEWTFDSEMILLTNTSFDFYKYSESRRTFVQRKSFPVPISWYRYSPEHHILVLSTSAASLYLFQIKPSYTANQLPSLKVISSKDGRASITKRQLSIITIHARVYCAFIYSKPQDPVILLFRLTKTSVRPEFELMLEQDGNYLLSTVDDLLVVHNLTAKHSSVFDLLSPRLGLLHLPDSVNSATSSGKVTRVWSICRTPISFEDSQLGLDNFYAQDWTTHPKSLVFCPSRGALFRLALSLSDLYAVLDGSRAPLMPVIEFLLRRSPTFNVTMLLAKLMRKIISAESEGMRDVRTVFEMVFADGEGGTSVAGSGGGESTVASLFGRRPLRHASSLSSLGSVKTSTRSVLAVSSQRRPEVPGDVRQPNSGLTAQDMYSFVFEPLSNDENIAPNRLTSCILEFIYVAFKFLPPQPVGVSAVATTTGYSPFKPSSTSRFAGTGPISINAAAAATAANQLSQPPPFHPIDLHHELLASLLLRSNRLSILHQLIATGTLKDTPGVARALLGSGGAGRPIRVGSGLFSTNGSVSPSGSRQGSASGASGEAAAAAATAALVQRAWKRSSGGDWNVPRSRSRSLGRDSGDAGWGVAGSWVLGISGGSELPGLIQAGVDMLGRLGLHDDVVDALLGIGKTQDAFRYALQMGIINQFPASAFLEPAYASGDKTLYLNIYKALEEVGAFSPLHVRPRGRPRFGRAADGGGGGYDDGDDDDDDGEGGGDPDGRYFSVYQELWSAVVEMEGI